MKDENEIKRQLEELYNHRLQSRIEWECKDGRGCGAGGGFECRNTVQEIEDEMFADISDPAICGAKEPKIAMLLWVLHGNRKGESTGDSSSSSGKG